MEDVALDSSADPSNYQFDYYALSKLKRNERRKILIFSFIIMLLLLLLIIFVILYTTSSFETGASKQKVSFLVDCITQSDCTENAYCAALQNSNKCQCKRGFIWHEGTCKDNDFSIEYSSRTIENIPRVSPVIFPETKELSACIWFRLNALPDGWKAIFMYSSYDIAKENDFVIWLRKSKISISFLHKDFDIVSNFNFTVKTWNHICWVWWDTSLIKLYHNAQLIRDVYNNQSEFMKAFPKSTGTLILGQDVDGGHISDPKQMFEGRLFNLFIYTRALSADEVVSVFENNPPLRDIVVGWWQFKGKANSSEIMEKPYPYDIEQLLSPFKY